MKKKLLLTSILSIVMCFSLICGATFALFTSESTVNIAVTSGTVKVEATIGDLTLSSTVDGVTTAGENGRWTNGGTATVDGGTVTLDKMMPGDTVSFNITVTNHSDVKVKARTIYTAMGELVGGLIIDGFGDAQKSGVTLWRPLEVGSAAEVYSVVITLDENAGNEYQNKSAAITFCVEAVQGNAQVDDPFTVRYGETEAKFVSLNEALACYEEAEASDVTIDVAKGTYYYSSVEVQQLANKNLTIKADKDATFVNNASGNPVFLVDGNSRSFGAETLKFDGLNFELNNSAYGIKFGDGNDLRYAHNVTVQNCSFVGTDNTGFALQSDSGSSCYKVDVSDCTAEGIDTFVSIYSTTLTVSGCTATNISGFVNNQTADAGTVTSLVNCNATVNEYIARVNGGTLNVEGSTLALESKCAYSTGAIVVRTNAAVVKLTNNTITATVADGVNGVATTICQSAAGLANVTNDKEYTICTGYQSTSGYVPMAWYNGKGENVKNGYAIFNADGFKHFSDMKLTGNNSVKEEVTIILTSDIDMKGAEFKAMVVELDDGDTLNFIGNGHTISNVNVVSGDNDNGLGQASLFYGRQKTSINVEDLKVENITVTSDTNNSGYAAAIIGDCEGKANLTNVDVTNATIIGAKSSGTLVGLLCEYATLTATDCDVTGTVTLNKYDVAHYAGKVIGTIAGSATLNNCTYTSVTVTGDLNTENKGDIYGRITEKGSLNVDGVEQE